MKRSHQILAISGLFIVLGIGVWEIYDAINASRVLPHSISGPKTSVWETSVLGVSLAGKTLALVNDGDFLLPKLSPNGKILAYAEVDIEKGTDNFNHEYTQIKLYDIVTHAKTTLLDLDGSKKFGCNKDYVKEIIWNNEQEVEVVFSNDDGGENILNFNLFTKQTVKTTLNVEDTLDDQLTPSKQKIFDQVTAIFPDFDKDVLSSTIGNGTFILVKQALVLQKRYAGQDSNVWLLDFNRKLIKQLLALPNEKFRLEGGFVFKEAVVFLVADNSLVRFYLYKQKDVKQIAKIVVKQRNIALDIKRRTADQVIFLVKMYDSYEKGNNPFYVFNGKNLFQINDCPDLYDADISSNGQVVVFCYWVNGERHLVVKETKI